ncbi:MAG: serine hydrolase domain-containing protein [Saprospiraceae bacterium]|nr:serine hydrolase domain-containing protein [Saprospiraceae bacterium]
MIRKDTLVLIAFIVFFVSHLQSQITNAQIDTIAKFIIGFPTNTEASIAIVNGKEVLYYGVKVENGKLIAEANKDKVFEIGSVTKVFTSTLLANLVKADKVALNTTIQECFIQPLSEKVKPITLLQLANHTSGLPRLPEDLFQPDKTDMNNPYAHYEGKMLEAYLSHQPTLATTPGIQYAYSNLGAGLLGYALEQKTGKNYEELLQEFLTNPYEMSSTTTERSKVAEKLVLGQNAQGAVTSNWDLNALKGAGGVLSTVEDLSKLVRANFQPNAVLELQREKTFTLNPNMDIALGWHIIKTQSGKTWHWHDGGTGGYTSSLAMDVTGQQSVIILTNISAFHSNMGNVDQLCFALMRTL